MSCGVFLEMQMHINIILPDSSNNFNIRAYVAQMVIFVSDSTTHITWASIKEIRKTCTCWTAQNYEYIYTCNVTREQNTENTTD